MRTASATSISPAWKWAFAETAGFYAVDTVPYWRWFKKMDDRPRKSRREVGALETIGVAGPGVEPALK